MGLFGSKKTYVASTVYNMAGAELDRVRFLKTVVIGGVIGTSKYSTADVIKNVYLSGPGIQARSFFRWALLNYSQIGVPSGFEGGVFNGSSSIVVPYLPVNSGQTAYIIRLEVGTTDYSFWAEQWMMENRPNLMGSAWVADLTADGIQIVITHADATTETFTPTGMVGRSRYVYAVYTPRDANNVSFNTRYWIYRIGSGNAELDAAAGASTNAGEWLPSIPFRINNQFLSSTYQSAAYELAKKAYRKASGRKKYQDIIDKIADNPNLADIDHAYMTYGVCLNVKENACREYIFRLFDKLKITQTYTQPEYTTYAGQYDSYDSSNGDGTWQAEPAFTEPGTPAPAPVYNAPYSAPIPPINKLIIKSEGPLIDVDLEYEIRWKFISKLTGTGLLRPGVHKKGAFWIEKGGIVDNAGGGTVFANTSKILFSGSDAQKIAIYSQISDNTWAAIELVGLEHRNNIYKKKSVDITAWEALDDVDDTGFIIPLHYPTLREMSLIRSTQMMTAATFMVFNSKKIVKQKWYQTTIFKIFIFIVIIAVTVLTMGTGTAPAIGLLGSAAAVGASLGLSGVIAVIVGTIANALVAMIISKIIGLAATAVFGEKWGAIIGTIVSMVVMSFGPGLANGQSLSTIWGSMMNPVNIINMTSSVGNGVAGFMQASAMGTMQKNQQVMAGYEKQYKEISDKIAQMYGGTRGIIDPLALTEVGYTNFFETEDAFLARTLMTGTDIANMTQDMLNNFVDYTTALPEPN